MRRLLEILLGVIMGALVAAIYISSIDEIPEYEMLVTEIEEVEEVPFIEQVKADEEEAFKNWLSVEPVVFPQPPFDDIALDADYQEFLQGRCIFHEVDFWLALALMESESSFNDEAVSKSGAKGLMQINECWWDEFEELDVNNPYDNIEMGLIILEDLLTRYDSVTAIHMYKCGEYRGLELMKEGIIIDQAFLVIERAEEMRIGHPIWNPTSDGQNNTQGDFNT